ncbi:hypothetical protein B5F14_08380 [Faecalitalea cylindroides]|uniref:Type I restriction modification DNA specificity domain-containing protein n=1 Tax=Faecalitalea cylindroides TaxID=39483 RepID=A0A1Y4LMZ2_9FIRM|nr:restriction endonuclease subunit S [Faecalitalea cylindroides]OUP58063.1 hypothetical protein B5F14_08380 [Faecalitalea cylindroides]
MRFIDCINITGESCKAYDGNKEYISTGAVDVDHIDQNQIEIVSYDSKPSRANLITNDRSILFAKMQGTKKVLLINQELEKNIYSTGFFSVSPKNNVLNKKCLYHLLGSKTFLSQKDKYCSGATQKAITLEGLKKIEITVPELEKQDQIAKILDTIKSILESYKKELENYDLLVRARFVEMFGDPILNEKGWPTKSLENACRIIVDCPHSTPSYTTENTGFMCIRTSIVKKNRIMWDEIEYISENEYNRRIQRKKPEKGDVIYTREGAVLGIAAVIDRDCNVALGQRSMLLSPDCLQCTPEFLSTAMNCDTFLANALKGQSGSASPHINVGDIKAFKMIMPPVVQQKDFSTFVEQVDKSKYDAMYVDINVLEYRCE